MRWWGEVEESKGRINGDRRRLYLEWWTHNTIYKWCIIELYTWNLYDFINQCYPNKFNFFKKHAISDYLVRGTDLLSLRLSNLKMTTANTIAIQCEWIKIIPIFLSDWQKTYFLVWGRTLVIKSTCAMRWKGWKSLTWGEKENPVKRARGSWQSSVTPTPHSPLGRQLQQWPRQHHPTWYSLDCFLSPLLGGKLAK